MNRRSFLRYVGTGLVVGPATVKAILAAPAMAAPHLAPWVGHAWWVKEFDFGRYLGVALGVTNPKTGKTVRNAVRIAVSEDNWPKHQEFMGMIFKAVQERGFEGLDSLPGAPDAVQAAQRLLETWAEEESYRQGLVKPPAWWRAGKTTRGIPDDRLDEVLEGKEMRL